MPLPNGRHPTSKKYGPVRELLCNPPLNIENLPTRIQAGECKVLPPKFCAPTAIMPNTTTICATGPQLPPCNPYLTSPGSCFTTCYYPPPPCGPFSPMCPPSVFCGPVPPFPVCQPYPCIPTPPPCCPPPCCPPPCCPASPCCPPPCCPAPPCCPPAKCCKSRCCTPPPCCPPCCPPPTCCPPKCCTPCPKTAKCNCCPPKNDDCCSPAPTGCCPKKKQGCCRGTGTKQIVCIPRGLKKPVGICSLTPQSACGSAGSGSGGIDQPPSYNNCNFYLTQIPKALRKGFGMMGGDSGSNCEEVRDDECTEGTGSDELCKEDDEDEECSEEKDGEAQCSEEGSEENCSELNRGAGDDRIFHPPAGYPYSQRTKWGNGPASGMNRLCPDPCAPGGMGMGGMMPGMMGGMWPGMGYHPGMGGMGGMGMNPHCPPGMGGRNGFRNGSGKRAPKSGTRPSTKPNSNQNKSFLGDGRQIMDTGGGGGGGANQGGRGGNEGGRGASSEYDKNKSSRGKADPSNINNGRQNANNRSNLHSTKTIGAAKTKATVNHKLNSALYRDYLYDDEELTTPSKAYLPESYPIPPPHASDKSIHPKRAPIVNYRNESCVSTATRQTATTFNTTTYSKASSRATSSKYPTTTSGVSRVTRSRAATPPKQPPKTNPAGYSLDDQRTEKMSALGPIKSFSEPNLRRKCKGKKHGSGDDKERAATGLGGEFRAQHVEEIYDNDVVPIYRTTTQTRVEILEKTDQPKQVRVTQRPVQEYVGHGRDPNANTANSIVNNNFTSFRAEIDGEVKVTKRKQKEKDPCLKTSCFNYNSRRLHRLCSFSAKRNKRLSELHKPACKFIQPACPIRETIASILRKVPAKNCEWHENKDIPPFHEYCMTDHNREVNRHRLLTRPTSEAEMPGVEKRGAKRKNHHR